MPSDAKEAKEITAVTALFDDSPGVERAYEIAAAHGYEIGDVNVVMSDEKLGIACMRTIEWRTAKSPASPPRAASWADPPVGRSELPSPSLLQSERR